MIISSSIAQAKKRAYMYFRSFPSSEDFGTLYKGNCSFLGKLCQGASRCGLWSCQPEVP